MKSKVALFASLSVILVTLVGSSVYVNFMATSASVISYVIMGQIILGVIATILTLLLGVHVYNSRKNHEILFLSFLEVLFVLSLVILNTTQGYVNVINEGHNYLDYMEYVSFNFNIYIYCLFAVIIGLITLTSFINYKTRKVNK